jgi:hypothetical protein
MPMATILVLFLMIGGWSLISASQQWGARRDAHSVAAAAARAGAQGDPTALRSGGVLDPDAATARANAIITAAGDTGTVTVNGAQVTVTVTVTVRYSFPSPSFPDTVAGTATAIAARGVDQAGAG